VRCEVCWGVIVMPCGLAWGSQHVQVRMRGIVLLSQCAVTHSVLPSKIHHRGATIIMHGQMQCTLCVPLCDCLATQALTCPPS
jgi:hypothetical protein